MPSNEDFLLALFGDDAPWAHVTDFAYDPNNIPPGEHLSAWKGDYYSRYTLTPGTNQYFTVSTFYLDEKGVARRRKALFRATHVIVLDDVKEKLSLEQVQKLPEPTWKLLSSTHSEQWGYLLDQPCSDRPRVENLLDGLVANGLAPAGKDPGMKGVTRYVRLPDGVNSKASRLVNGQPFQCRLTHWEPFNRVTLQQLATPFAVDLDAPRREQRVDGAADVEDHPLLQIPDLIHIKEKRSDGRFDITCPWVDEHTGADDSGSAIFTNSDGTLGFKCHHGACEGRTGADLLAHLEADQPGFRQQLKNWQLHRSFQQVMPQAPQTPPAPAQQTLGQPPAPALTERTSDVLRAQMNQLRRMIPNSEEAREQATTILKVVDDMKEIQRLQWHDEIRDVMRWTKPELKKILDDERQEWYTSSNAVNFYDEVIFIRELNRFYDRAKRIFYSPESYQNSYADLDPEVRKQALQGGLVTKVDKLDYAPKMPPVFTENGVTFGNSWSDVSEVTGRPGDITPYLRHFDVMGWSENRKHIMQWMAWTIRHPDIKINHMILLGSMEGGGKDWILEPLVKAMGDNHTTISGEELPSDYNDYLLSTKHLNVNETELGDRQEVGAKIKPLAAAPPHYIRINQKHVAQVKVRNIVSISMTTNSQVPIKLRGTSRRIYAVWSDLCIRGDDGEIMPQWRDYWAGMWKWMNEGGAEAVINYLRHEIDLSDFNPGAAPPMTEFLRTMQDAGKTLLQQTLEAFIMYKAGAFESDLVSCEDVVATLRAGKLFNDNITFIDTLNLTPTKVGVMLREMQGPQRLQIRSKGTDRQVWAVRNAHVYQQMSRQQVWDEYERQMTKAKDSSDALRVVK